MDQTWKLIGICMLLFALCAPATANQHSDLAFILKAQFFLGAYDTGIRENLEASLSTAEVAELNRFISQQTHLLTVDQENYKRRYLADICVKRGVNTTAEIAKAEFDLDSNYYRTRVRRLRGAISRLSANVQQQVQFALDNIGLGMSSVPQSLESAEDLRVGQSEDEISSRLEFTCTAYLFNDTIVPVEEVSHE